MTLSRLIWKIFIALSIFLLSNIYVAEALPFAMSDTAIKVSDDVNRMNQTPNYNGGREAETDGKCSLDDNAKKNMADQAYKSLYEAVHLLVDFNKSMMKYFEDENGSCHYLYTKKFETNGMLGNLSDDASRQDLYFTSTARAGSKVVDELKKMNPTATTMLNDFNEKITYLGLDVRQLMKRGAKGDRQSNKMVAWSQTAKKGETFEIDEATSELLEETFGYKTDCKYAVMTDDNGSFSCYQLDVNAQTIVYGKTVQEIQNAVKRTGAVTAFSCTKDNCSNGKGPLGEQVEGLLQQSEKCMKDLEVAAVQRDELIAKRKEAHNLLDVLSGNLEVHCTCETKESNGEKTEVIKDCTAVNPDFIENNMKECPTLQEYQLSMTGSKGENCLTCRLFYNILRAVQDIAQKAYDALAPSFKGLLGIGFGIYIGYITLLAIASPAEQKIGKYLSDLTTQGFKVAIAIILLSAPAFIYGTVIGPLMEGGVEFGISLTQENEAKIKEYGANFEFKAENTYLQSPVLQNTVGAAVAFSEAASLVPAIGRSLICNSWQDYTWWDRAKDLFGGGRSEFWPRLKMIIEGVIFYIFGMMIALGIGFYMLDCALQLGIVCAMMPLFVASWPFKITRSYTERGWNIFLNTFFNFVVMGVIISATSGIMMQALATGLNADNLISVINSGDHDLILETIEFGGMEMLMLVICSLLALKMVKEIQNITNKLSGGLNVGIGAGIGGTVGSTAAKVAAVSVASAAIATKATAMGMYNNAKDRSDDDTIGSSTRQTGGGGEEGSTSQNNSDNDEAKNNADTEDSTTEENEQ